MLNSYTPNTTESYCIVPHCIVSYRISDGLTGAGHHKDRHAEDLHGEHPQEEDWGNTPIDADFDFTHEPAGCVALCCVVLYCACADVCNPM